jgi:HJR/Mrr/RecB family endonuclease
VPNMYRESEEMPLVTSKDVEDGDRARHKATRMLAEAKSEVSELGRSLSRVRLRLAAARFKRWWAIPARRFCRATMTVAGGYSFGVLVAFAVPFVLTGLAGVPSLIGILVALGLASLVAWQGLALFRPSEEEIESQIATLESEFMNNSNRLAQAVKKVTAMTTAAAVAGSNAEQTRRLFEGKINQLRSSHWRGMTGIEFENFLADVFREWGYVVETTKSTGDQGVDLVISKGGRRVAVQAKGYPGTTVGNKAIQEAHAGRSFYRCDSSAVITNSSFTTGAVELAKSVDCALIDGPGIVALLNGKVPF